MISIFRDINKFATKFKSLDVLAIFCARFLPYLMGIFLFLYFIYISHFLLFVCAFLSGLVARFVINEIIHIFYKEQRPAYLQGTKVLIPVPKNPSFPSGHASFFFGISFFLLSYNFYFGLALILVTFLIGIARVFCGVHWFRDVLAGALAGLISSSVIYYLSTLL